MRHQAQMRVDAAFSTPKNPGFYASGLAGVFWFGFIPDKFSPDLPALYSRNTPAWTKSVNLINHSRSDFRQVVFNFASIRFLRRGFL